MKYFVRAFTELSFSGRVSRKTFWAFYPLALLLLFFCVAIVGLFTFFVKAEQTFATILLMTPIFIFFLPMFSMQIRRLHDAGYSEWALLCSIIPFVGWLLLIVLFLQKGEPGPNKYGPPDLPRDDDPSLETEADYLQLEIQLPSSHRTSNLPADSKNGSTWLKIASIGLLVTCIALAATCATLVADKNTLLSEKETLAADLTAAHESLSGTKEHYKNLSGKHRELQEDYDELWDEFVDYVVELSFWRECAVIVTTTGAKYHTYGCPHIEGRDFYVYNIENAIYKGYKPCLDCIDNNETKSTSTLEYFRQKAAEESDWAFK